MRTYKRVCIEDYTVLATNGDTLTLRRGKEYTTSAERDGAVVTVYSNFWVAGIPVRIFAGPVLYTP